MREIKFRAWDTMDKKWLRFSFGIDPDGTVRSRAHVTGGMKMGYVILCQFTGLLDKNGKEIFGGDIVRWTRKKWRCFGHPMNGKDLIEICEVYWREDKYGFWNDHRNEEGRVYCSGPLGFEDDRADINFIEVIGNIYESPELLKESK